MKITTEVKYETVLYSELSQGDTFKAEHRPGTVWMKGDETREASSAILSMDLSDGTLCAFISTESVFQVTSELTYK